MFTRLSQTAKMNIIVAYSIAVGGTLIGGLEVIKYRMNNKFTHIKKDVNHHS
jgi:hypothetical protein